MMNNVYLRMLISILIKILGTGFFAFLTYVLYPSIIGICCAIITGILIYIVFVDLDEFVSYKNN